MHRYPATVARTERVTECIDVGVYTTLFSNVVNQKKIENGEACF